MKNLKIVIVILTVALIGFISCKKDEACTSRPNARIVNDGSAEAKVQIKTSNGNTVNLNNVPKGTASEYVSYDSGIIEFTVTVKSTKDSVNILPVTMANCYNYDIRVDAENKISFVQTGN